MQQAERLHSLLSHNKPTIASKLASRPRDGPDLYLADGELQRAGEAGVAEGAADAGGTAQQVVRQEDRKAATAADCQRLGCRKLEAVVVLVCRGPLPPPRHPVRLRFENITNDQNMSMRATGQSA